MNRRDVPVLVVGDWIHQVRKSKEGAPKIFEDRGRPHLPRRQSQTPPPRVRRAQVLSRFRLRPSFPLFDLPSSRSSSLSRSSSHSTVLFSFLHSPQMLVLPSETSILLSSTPPLSVSFSPLLIFLRSLSQHLPLLVLQGSFPVTTRSSVPSLNKGHGTPTVPTGTFIEGVVPTGTQSSPSSPCLPPTRLCRHPSTGGILRFLCPSLLSPLALSDGEARPGPQGPQGCPGDCVGVETLCREERRFETAGGGGTGRCVGTPTFLGTLHPPRS